MQHNTNPTNAAANRPSPGDPDDANLEAYGDWVTVHPDPAPFAQSPPDTDADIGDTHEEPDSRAAQGLTEAEEELLDQLTESERVPAAAPAPATAGPAAGDPSATTAALAKLERQLSSLNADLKAVGQQLAELRGRADAVPAPAAAATDVAASPDDPFAITLEEEQDPAVPLEAGAAAQAPPADASDVPRAPRPDAPPAGRETPAADLVADGIQLEPEPESEPEPPAGSPVEALPAEDPPVATAPGAGAETGGRVRDDVRAVLAYLDQLLDALPPDKVREFAQSEHFATYKKLFKEFGLDD